MEEIMSSSSTKMLDVSAIALAIACGVGSVVFFALCPLGSLRVVRLSWSEPWLLCCNTLLSFTFFLQHSGMNRRRFRNWLTKRLAPRYHGALYSIASGVALMMVVAFWQPTATQVLIVHGMARWLVRTLGTLALGVFIWSAFSLLKFDPLGLCPISAHLHGAPTPSPRFIVRGPYRWVRHPLYSCVIVMIWTWPELTSDRLLFNLIWTIWICVGAHLEEGDLASDFGDDYRDYQRRVPMLVPWPGRTAPRRTQANATA
jgi:methanethiol S-methyltransferase